MSGGMWFDGKAALVISLRSLSGACQESSNFRLGEFFSLDFTFPDDKASPACGLQDEYVFYVASFVSLNFREPVCRVCLGFFCTGWAVVAMPKTTMHEYDRLATDESNIRGAGNVFAVQAVAAIPQLAA